MDQHSHISTEPEVLPYTARHSFFHGPTCRPLGGVNLHSLLVDSLLAIFIDYSVTFRPIQSMARRWNNCCVKSTDAVHIETNQ